MKSKSILLLATAAIMLAACDSRSYQITGIIDGAANGDTLFLTTDMQTGTPMDTVVVVDGKFTIKGETDSVTLAMIYSASHNALNTPFFLEPGHIKLTLSEEMGASRVGGTKVNNLWQQHTDSVMNIGKDINKIAEHIYGATISPEEQQKGMEQIERMTERFNRMVIKTAEENIDNEFGYFLLTYYPEEVIDNNNKARLIKLLPADKRQRPAIRQLEAMLETSAKTAEGATIGDFSQPGPDGNALSIMSVVSTHKITVIDFWASWCGPCRQEMPFMIDMYKELKEKGLAVVGISLDSDRDSWLQATKQLNIPWPQMSDLKGWENAIAQQFNVSSIPHTIVVDQKGKILRRGLRGESLKEFVSSQLK